MGQTVTKDAIALVDLKGGFPECDVLCVYGVGEGFLYRSFSSALKKEEKRFLIFIEKDEEIFLKAKELPLAKDPKVRLLYWNGDEEIFQQIAWEFVFLNFGYAVLDPQKTAEAEIFFTQLEHFHRGVNLLASDCEDMGVKVLSNALANLSHFSKARLGHALEGMCKGLPAIICGAGPSLNDAIPLLSELKDKAVIIAGGSAIRALNAHGIEPHFCAGVDPAPPEQRYLEQDSFETPFFYQGRISHQVLSKVHGPLVWMADGGNYPLEGWLAAECGVYAERFEAGWTVSNFCAALAAHMGFSTVIFVGMDLSCSPDTIYAANIRGDEHRNELIELEKGKLYSKRDWLMSAEWVGAFAHSHPATQWINATSGGIDLPGIERKNLEEATSSFSEWDVNGFVKALILGAPHANAPSEKVADVRRRVKESFEKCAELCDALLKVWEKHYPHSPLEKGEYAVLDVELEQESCYRYFLAPIWNVWKRPILRTSFHPLGQHVHRLLFFKKALAMHLPSLRSFS